MGTIEGLIIAALTLIGGWFGGFFGTYMRKKGDNLATHEDFERLLAEQKRTTQATKEIEAKISDDMWNQQKRWELKRDILFNAAKRLAQLDDAALTLVSIYEVSFDNPNVNWEKERLESMDKWQKASMEYEETRVLIGVICEEPLIVSFRRFGSLARNIVTATCNKKRGTYDKSESEFLSTHAAAQDAIRKELGFEPLPTPRSSESSEAPIPD
ncbi:MAG TPA: hypothetical protein VKR52_04585 [Terracidiphilus sp.]|nr:hypothetical protein [Terracidiphilus sp.]